MAGGAARRHRTAGTSESGVEGNRRLTSLAGVLLLALLILQMASALFFALLVYNVALPAGPVFDAVRATHFFVGFLVLPLVAVKMASTGYRFLRYYLRSAAYRAAGHPNILLRFLVAPLLVVSTVTLVFSGVEMWSFQNQFGWAWVAIHDCSAFAFVTALAVHVVLHVRDAHRDAAADLAEPAAGSRAEPLGGVVTRRALLGGGTVAGLALAVGAAQWPTPLVAWLAPRRAGRGALDFPVMNYEGGAQIVDPALWRLRVTGDVRRPLSLSEADLLALPAESHRYAINCVTGWTAERTWRGVPPAVLLSMAGADRGFGHVLVRSTSGYHWDHRRDHVLAGGALLVTHVDGVRLNDAHGYPSRLMIPGLPGEALIKWVDELRVTRGASELYLGPHVDFSNPNVTGPLLPRDPAGRYP